MIINLISHPHNISYSVYRKLYLLLLVPPDELTTFTTEVPDECGGFDGEREWM